MNEAAPQRLFFAITPDQAERARLGALALRLPLDQNARRVAAEDYHLTVAFVGEATAAQCEILRRIGAASRCPAFGLHFDAYEYWPKPEVVVVTARNVPAALQGLWRDLHARLAEAGFALDPKRLRPHMTLARGVRTAPALPALPPSTGVDCEARALCLLRSARERGPPAYTVVDHWPLLYEARTD